MQTQHSALPTYNMTLIERLELRRPKRLLSIDGGGIRGIIAAEILIKIEDLLCRPNSRWRCLADYFDFIGGTSTGAILATGLALGMSARELRDFYVRLGPIVFHKRWLIGRLWSKYDARPLERQLQYLFGDALLGSDQLRTLLMLVAKNVAMDKIWFFVNNPRNKFIGVNGKIPLWRLVRASTAAPTFFSPYALIIGNGREIEFIDGGVSMFNNPSFRLFLEATIPRYAVGWEVGADQILLISIGTGFQEKKITKGKAKNYTLLHWAPYLVEVLLEDANTHQDILMKLISHVPKPESIEGEMEGLSMPTANEVRQLQAYVQAEGKDVRATAFETRMLTYHRYTTALTRKRFDRLGLPQEIDPEKVARIDCIDQVEALRVIGQAVAKEQVSPEDFRGFLHEDK